MKSINFTPWVGSSYSPNGYKGKKILLLGESHYGNCSSNATTTVVKDYLEYKNGNKRLFARWMNTFTKFTNRFLEAAGETCNDETIKKFWNSVMFYNYVQKAIEGPRQAPTQQMFKDSENAFFEILNEYKLDIVIAWGKRLWRNLPDGVRSLDIPIDYVAHPSTPYFNSKCSGYFKKIFV